jgi:uncharacterized repeat protein (TIGR01451 family)
MKIVKYISFLTLMVIALSTFILPVTALAQEGETEPVLVSEPELADNITLTTEFPKIEAIATGSFQFNIDMSYRGNQERVFDLKATAPSGWDVYIEPQYESGKRISSVTMAQSYSGISKTVKLTATAPSYPVPDPGDYKILLKVTSANVTGSIELTAKITAKYTLQAVPLNQLYNVSATAGKDNIFSIQVTNSGTAPIENITFTSTHPTGWEIKFTPEKMDNLKTVDPQTVDVNIKPAPKTVAGDYMISLNINGKQASADRMDIRVTVKTPTIWGWAGVIIIVIVVVGLFIIFIRFGRR